MMGMVCLAKGMTASLLAACLLSAGLVPAVWLPAHAAGPPRPAADSLQPAARPATERAHAAGPQDMKPAVPSSGVRYGLVIAGLGGEQKYVDQHLTWARGFYEVLKVEHGFPEDRLFLLVEDPDA
ncbi:MAG: hypothetical protein OXI19_10480, partial [Gemmatimonadota bacterium]|nr:hypothetical protein [Gemmatimonadota bacterium]